MSDALYHVLIGAAAGGVVALLFNVAAFWLSRRRLRPRSRYVPGARVAAEIRKAVASRASAAARHVVLEDLANELDGADVWVLMPTDDGGVP